MAPKAQNLISSVYESKEAETAVVSAQRGQLTNTGSGISEPRLTSEMPVRRHQPECPEVFL